MKNLFLIFLFFPLFSFAGTLYCENFDLATTDIFGSVKVQTSLEEIKNHGLKLHARHNLVSSDFYLNWNSTTHVFEFKIVSTEYANSSASRFSLTALQFTKGFRLGFNSIELTGLGDNVHARCTWSVDN